VEKRILKNGGECRRKKREKVSIGKKKAVDDGQRNSDGGTGWHVVYEYSQR